MVSSQWSFLCVLCVLCGKIQPRFLTAEIACLRACLRPADRQADPHRQAEIAEPEHGTTVCVVNDTVVRAPESVVRLCGLCGKTGAFGILRSGSGAASRGISSSQGKWPKDVATGADRK